MKQRSRKSARARARAKTEPVVGNIDLLPQILVRLPAKSLIRFKRVSKAWFSLVSDSRFCVDYTVHNFGRNHYQVSEFFQQTVGSYINPKPEPILRFSLHSRRRLLSPASIYCSESLHIIYPCNGLILCRDIQTKDYLVYNFTTQNHRLLPAPPLGCHSSEGLALAFDPSKSCHYKFVQFGRRIKRGDKPYTREIHIFSSESGTWKELRVASPGGLFSTGQQVYWNGAFHWIHYKNVHIQFEVDQEKFTCHNLKVSRKFSYLDISPENTKIKYFGESGGTLILIIQSHNRRSDYVYTMLEMKQDSKCWEVRYQLDLRLLLTELPYKLAHPRLLFELFSIRYVKSQTKDEDLTLVLYIGGKIISYLVNKVDYSITKGGVLGKHDTSSYFHLYPVFRCLVPTVL